MFWLKFKFFRFKIRWKAPKTIFELCLNFSPEKIWFSSPSVADSTIRHDFLFFFLFSNANFMGQMRDRKSVYTRKKKKEKKKKNVFQRVQKMEDWQKGLMTSLRSNPQTTTSINFSRFFIICMDTFVKNRDFYIFRSLFDLWRRHRRENLDANRRKIKLLHSSGTWLPERSFRRVNGKRKKKRKARRDFWNIRGVGGGGGGGGIRPSKTNFSYNRRESEKYFSNEKRLESNRLVRHFFSFFFFAKFSPSLLLFWINFSKSFCHLL